MARKKLAVSTIKNRAPINGGPNSRQLTPEQKQKDYQARMILTEELGHSREQITVNYLGR